MINCPTCVYADFEKDKCKRLLTRLPHVCPYAVERKPRNHFEEIKAMSVEQIAEWFADKDCPPGNCTHAYDGIDCAECWLDWLKEEVKE